MSFSPYLRFASHLAVLLTHFGSCRFCMASIDSVQLPGHAAGPRWARPAAPHVSWQAGCEQVQEKTGCARSGL